MRIFGRLIPNSSHFASIFRWEKKLLFRFFITSVCRTLALMAVVYFIQESLSNISESGQGRFTAFMAKHIGPIWSLWANVGLLFAASVAGSLFNYDSQVVQQRLIKLFELGTMERLIRHLLHLSVPFIDGQSPGDLIQAVRQDVMHYRRMILSVATILLEGMLAFGLIIVCLWLSPWLAFWSLVALPIALLPIGYLAQSVRTRSDTIRTSGYVFADIILQILSGIRVLKAFRAEDQEARITTQKGNAFFDEMIESARLRSLGQVILDSLATLGLVAVIIIGSFQVRGGNLSWAGLVAFLMAARTLNGPLNNIYSAFMEIQNFKASVDRISGLLQTQPQVCDQANPERLLAAPNKISFSEVSFGYSDEPVLRSISFEVRAGETIAIIGPSGAGKSTLLNLVARFYDPSNGVVSYDNRPLRQLQLSDIYDHIAIVTQDPFLFATTVKENIRCGRPNATDADVVDAARAAHVHADIENLPNGYNTLIGLNGRTISRGQAQRINLARAFIKKAAIVLLDEPTSSLDSIAEVEVQKAMDELMKGRTNFLVTHRFSSLRSADRILLLEDGEIEGFGTHEELYRECELYRNMFDIQRLEESVEGSEKRVTPKQTEKDGANNHPQSVSRPAVARLS